MSMTLTLVGGGRVAGGAGGRWGEAGWLDVVPSRRDAPVIPSGGKHPSLMCPYSNNQFLNDGGQHTSANVDTEPKYVQFPTFRIYLQDLRSQWPHQVGILGRFRTIRGKHYHLEDGHRPPLRCTRSNQNVRAWGQCSDFSRASPRRCQCAAKVEARRKQRHCEDPRTGSARTRGRPGWLCCVTWGRV